MPTQQIPSYSHPLINRRTGQIDSVWYQFLMRLTSAANSGGGGGNAPADAQYIVGAADADLPNARVPTDSPSIDFDLGTAAQLKAHVRVDTAGALDGGTSDDLKVRVDGTTIQINGSNNLEVIGGGAWIPLSAGVEPLTFISDGAGQAVLVAYP